MPRIRTRNGEMMVTIVDQGEKVRQAKRFGKAMDRMSAGVARVAVDLAIDSMEKVLVKVQPRKPEHQDVAEVYRQLGLDEDGKGELNLLEIIDVLDLWYIGGVELGEPIKVNNATIR